METMDLPKNKPLPDVAYDAAQFARPLDWVGMAHVALPLRWHDALLSADADVFVNLTDPDARGIHMSRLYLHIQNAFAERTFCRNLLQDVLEDLVESQGDTTSAARLVLRFPALLSRKALASDNAGWRSYPLTVTAQLDPQRGFSWELSFAVQYSSTCPASAALSRRAIADAFSEHFAGNTSVDAADVAAWLSSREGLAATPHAQRSNADVTVRLSAAQDELPFESLLDALESSLATVVQTAVKREDEQAFARLNAQNLMFCEDASRRVAATLSQRPEVISFTARIEHLESLHAHDAVAMVQGKGAATA